jgi:hypothetical protein
VLAAGAWLHLEDGVSTCHAVIKSQCCSSARTLQFLLDKYEWTEPQVSRLLDLAAMHSQLEAAQLLLQRGAQWPQLRCSPWPDDVMAWAKQQGCTAPLTQSGKHDHFGAMMVEAGVLSGTDNV